MIGRWRKSELKEETDKLEEQIEAEKRERELIEQRVSYIELKLGIMKRQKPDAA